MNRRNSVLLFLALLLLFCTFAAARAASLQMGSTGDEVKTLQTKLKRWGYYGGAADGHFGAATKKAVIAFQQKNGLTPDGVVGEATARALGMQLGGGSSSKKEESGGGGGNDAYLLARLIYGEARGEPYKGKVAVAAVALNRVKSPSFPNSVAGVVYQSGAFDVVADGQINLAPDAECIRAARDAMNGYDPTNGCLFYHNPAKSTSSWMRDKPIKVTIGSHAFF
ncbi:MAG: spore cortex-lytic enzyme [Eubacteriales bacterium]|nr:spore cortex-lytic enzyme [Eubacteriales bacterium]